MGESTHDKQRSKQTKPTAGPSADDRYGASPGRGADAEWGARILLEKEIMSKPLNALVERIDNDSEK